MQPGEARLVRAQEGDGLLGRLDADGGQEGVHVVVDQIGHRVDAPAASRQVGGFFLRA